MRLKIFCVGLFFVFNVWAGESIQICYNYSCSGQTAVTFDDARLQSLGDRLRLARDAASEREALSQAIAQLYRWAGEQSPIGADKRGDLLDDGVDGRMDCIDHSTTTARFLKLIEAHGWLRYHKVAPIAMRRSWIIFQHYSAVIEELAAPRAEISGLVKVGIRGYERPYDRDFDDRPMRQYAPSAERPAAKLLDNKTGEQSIPQKQNVPQRFVVDSWFVDFGEPPIVMPLPEWLDGKGPNVS